MYYFKFTSNTSCVLCFMGQLNFLLTYRWSNPAKVRTRLQCLNIVMKDKNLLQLYKSISIKTTYIFFGATICIHSLGGEFEITWNRRDCWPISIFIVTNAETPTTKWTTNCKFPQWFFTQFLHHLMEYVWKESNIIISCTDHQLR